MKKFRSKKVMTVLVAGAIILGRRWRRAGVLHVNRYGTGSATVGSASNDWR